MRVCVHEDNSETFSYALWFSVFLVIFLVNVTINLKSSAFFITIYWISVSIVSTCALAFPRLHKYGSFSGLTKSAGCQYHYLTKCPSFWTTLLCQLQCVLSRLSTFIGPFHPVSSRKEACVPTKYVILAANKTHRGVLRSLFLQRVKLPHNSICVCKLPRNTGYWNGKEACSSIQYRNFM